MFLRLFPTFMAAATGIIINEDTSRTPTVTMESETTSDNIMVDTIWKIATLSPTSFA